MLVPPVESGCDHLISIELIDAWNSVGIPGKLASYAAIIRARSEKALLPIALIAITLKL
jgi:hypothetical protein